MNLRVLSILALASCSLSSCIYYTTPVPEMPYRPYRPNPVTASENNAAFAAASQYEGAWYTGPTAGPALPTATPWSGGYQTTAADIPPPTAATPAPKPAQPVTLKPATPAPKPAVTKPASAITQPQLKPLPKSVAVKPATPAPTPAKAASAPRDPKSITNDGPIPVATPVPGDPTRVYNPVDSSKTIRITDKNGKIYPSGKELKVRGTNFHFYVP